MRSLVVACVADLADTARRGEAAGRLAAILGCSSLLLLVRDPQVEAMVPAPGFPRTLPGGTRWARFLRECLEPGRHESEVELPPQALQRAVGHTIEGAALVLLGDVGAAASELDEVLALMPLVARGLQLEHTALLAQAEARDARALASKGEFLALALDSTRGETARLNAELHAEHRRKDEFLAILAHELRNPLAPLINSIELLRLRALHDSDVARLVPIMARQASHLARLVDDLLDISRVTRGKVTLRCKRLPLWDAVRNALEMNRALLESLGHHVREEAPASPLFVWGDEVRITQVMSNLIHNAAKYTPAGGHIRISGRTQGAEAVVEVEDDGIGIAPESLGTVFELFAQAPVTMDQARGGLGIGLTLVKRLVEMHGGRVSAHSEGSRGTRFSVRLPLHCPEVAQAVGA